MTVHKKHSAVASAFVKTTADKKAMADKEEKPKEEVIVSDVITETTERVEIVEEKVPESSSPADPLSDFKEKMIKEEKSPISGTPSKKNFMWPILFIFIAALVLLTAIFAYKQEIFKGKEVNVVSLSPTPTITPEPTKITVDPTKYEIEIQNGSEVAGEAGRQQASLEEEGFTISSIGNADNSDYTETIIQAKKEVDKDFLAKLKTVLEISFTVSEIESLSEDSSVPIVVILGAKK